MNSLTMLNAFDHLVEDRLVDDENLKNDYEVEVAGSQVLRGKMYIVLRANDGTTRHYRLTEV